ncbi:hypothetical protein FHS34_001662 [Streptomyces echinatus]|uniref:Uncharacterized protein n=1 Tax=Streptomyces echinatus TaxID=67293 RepID=A0A7W9UPC6_9ACTN|nr:hypothetical protein [Streptomyces echinatus]
MGAHRGGHDAPARIGETARWGVCAARRSGARAPETSEVLLTGQ